MLDGFNTSSVLGLSSFIKFYKLWIGCRWSASLMLDRFKILLSLVLAVLETIGLQ